MLEEAERQTPDSVAVDYAETYREMRRGLHRRRRVPLPRRRRGVSRPRRRQPRPASRSCCSTSPTRAVGSTRMRQPSRRRVPRRGRVAPSGGDRGRRRPPLRPRLLARLARGDRRATRSAEGLPLHVHADEQPREIEECLAEHGCRPIELLADTGCLSERTTIVHATHAERRRSSTSSRPRDRRICACPTTEADLGDGFLPADRRARPRDPALHRLGLERAHRPARGAAGARGDRATPDGAPGVFTTAQLLAIGSAEGARALGLEEWPSIEIDSDHRSLAGVAAEHVEAALIAGCTADVVLSRGA